jgi:RNA polymerase sigma-70 factor (ECF subfamily)
LAEDVLQDCLIDMYRRWDRISSGEANPLGYAVRVMGSKTANHRRTAWSRKVSTTDDAASLDHTEGNEVDGVHNRLVVAEALSRLSPRQRQVVALHYLLDMPVADISRDLGRPLGSITSDLTRARKHLRLELGGGGGVDE